MKVLTFTSYKEHCELYTIIHGLIAVRGCQIGLARKDIISDTAMITVMLYEAGSCVGIGDRQVKFTLSAETYSIDDLNT